MRADDRADSDLLLVHKYEDKWYLFPTGETRPCWLLRRPGGDYPHNKTVYEELPSWISITLVIQ